MDLAESFTEFVIATPPGRGAVATVLVNGPQATTAVSRWFRPAVGKPLSDLPLSRIVFGQWHGLADHREELVVCRRDEDQLAIHCHGGTAAVEAISAALCFAGCRPVDWQTLARAISCDPISAEAQIQLAAARTERTAGILLDQSRGALRQSLSTVLQSLVLHDLETASQLLARLHEFADVGRHLVQPWRIVLAGRTNVGKSSLINALLGYRRSIVFDQPGTTRDVVTGHTALDGWPVEFADTAGLRLADDDVESQGVSRARQRMAEADQVVLVFDSSRQWTPEDDVLLAEARSALIVHNKCDLGGTRRERPAGLFVSELTGEEIPTLIQTLVTRLIPAPPPPGTAVPFQESQITAIGAAWNAVRSGNTPDAIDLVRNLVGP